MRIKIINNKRKIFSEIIPGDVFAHQGNFYIKTSNLNSEFANAVRLATGAWKCFAEGDVIEKCNAELCIECGLLEYKETEE